MSWNSSGERKSEVTSFWGWTYSGTACSYGKYVHMSEHETWTQFWIDGLDVDED